MIRPFAMRHTATTPGTQASRRGHSTRWRPEVTTLLTDLLWACLIVAVAAYGAVVVRNVTDTLMAIAYHQPSIVVADKPSR
ncbi:MAG: hypothetical protein P4L90_17830 [Rhodopila sp.]|nr:hypothetical protein [Rhodopila sp.]